MYDNFCNLNELYEYLNKNASEFKLEIKIDTPSPLINNEECKNIDSSIKVIKL